MHTFSLERIRLSPPSITTLKKKKNDTTDWKSRFVIYTGVPLLQIISSPMKYFLSDAANFSNTHIASSSFCSVCFVFRGPAKTVSTPAAVVVFVAAAANVAIPRVSLCVVSARPNYFLALVRAVCAPWGGTERGFWFRKGAEFSGQPWMSCTTRKKTLALR